ncbi:hypothetical protein M8C13_09070 [Crossiella sp. SN42]|uniref:hypothetical protein n=1 Tax=Crossiella sp. SN42 TaxID=2944808 RepID=UPI00207C66D4|nr:hypothetical protein [Crossiella sp. SN42]MCO1575907.1 hypothetical protein [Crossiella sp. SN42]
MRLLCGIGALIAAVVLVFDARGAFALSVLAQAKEISVDELFANIRNWVVGILTGLATVALTIGGIRYVSSGANPAGLAKARTALECAIGGYLLAALAPVVVRILRGIVGL